MPDPIWQKNLRDAVLLDPLVILHGNVKDIFPVPAGTEGRLPPTLRQSPYVPFDVWAALELERLGFEIVVLFDSIDGAVALRGGMVSKFNRLAAGRGASADLPSENTVQPPTVGNASGRATEAAAAQGASTNSALPRAEPAMPTQDWMAPIGVRLEPLAFFRTLYENVFTHNNPPVGVICRFTDRYLSFTDRQQAGDKALSLVIQKAAMSVPQQASQKKIGSRLLLIFNTEGEVPQELNVQAPFSRSVLIHKPALAEREQFFRDNLRAFDPGDPGDRFDANDPEHLRLIGNVSDGLNSQDLFSLIALSRREKLGLGPRQIKELLDRFKFGTRENAWLKVDPAALRGAKERLRVRVKGQDDVIDEVIPVLVRAKLGMTDIGSSRHSTKPRGVFFFVGPTGVGKTELSKAIAELIFGDEQSLIRFDMSEYSEEHQQARLIGAPPGYVGFDQGGQLTNAIIEKPFSVVLFDEIEKAHGRILDKFLQILDDGRLTDGMGRTVYFSEAIIIFTSNLGTAPAARLGGQRASLEIPGTGEAHLDRYSQLAELSYVELTEHFRREVKEFFVNTLGRPEILNRIGEDNILVFRFLSDKGAKMQIVDQQVETLQQYLQQRHQLRGIYCTRGFRQLLMFHPSGFGRNGARGVRNLLNRFVLNPLAQALFDNPEKCRQKIFKVDYRVALERVKDEPFDATALAYEWITP